jgi:hypothetical protein
MINKSVPNQPMLFDVNEFKMHPKAYDRLRSGWQGLFRETILQLMPVEGIEDGFSETTGQPTKELYSMCGLVFIMEFMDWTIDEAVDAYIYRTDIQYALNLDSTDIYLSERTVYRYKALLVENELAGQIMQEVTKTLVEMLGIKIDKQRLDSTHIESDMATFGRTQLLTTAMKRFLAQLNRHNKLAYESLDAELRRRYEKSPYQLFGGKKQTDDDKRLLRQQIIQDIYDLITQFADTESHRSSYKDLVLIFDQQCEIIPEEDDEATFVIELKKSPGGNIICNPSDPDATYDGKKGAGYQAQLSETCSEENEVQLITSAIPQTACESDAGAVEMVVEDLKKNELLPDELSADTAYGSDENQQRCEEEGVELVSPVPGKRPEDADGVNSADFEMGEDGEVLSCPMCQPPIMSTTGKTSTGDGVTLSIMDESRCRECLHRENCPVKQDGKGRHCVEFTDKQRRLAVRRRNEETDEFREKYRIRSGIEATNSSIKRVTGLARLRVRGKAAVFHAILLKVAGWNILQAARALRLRSRALNGQNASNRGILHVILSPYFTIRLAQNGSASLFKASPPFFKNHPSLFPSLAN